ncbi:MAG: hypothetical protein JRI68_12540 [Deltaproteobacteria bacterium]|nr:hypothetical protein [Deltaproteobacteria bacterium]
MTGRTKLPWRVALVIGFGLSTSSVAAQTATATPTATPTATASSPVAIDGGSPAPAAQPASSAQARPSLPAGHPRTDQTYQPIPDRTVVNQALPPGTLEVVILGADQQPIAGAPVTLDVSRSNAAGGQKRRRLTGTTDARGRHTFEGLDTGRRASYRLVTERGPASYASQPFNLTEQHGATSELHAYEVVESLAEAAVVIQAVLLIELERSSIAVNHLLHIINVGKKAYVTSDLALPLPLGYRGFTHEPGMTGATVTERHGHAVLTGTFPPGKQDLRFSYHLPLEGTGAQQLSIPLPPRVARTRVMLGAGGSLGLRVSGFPEAKPGRPHRGRPVVETARAIDITGEHLAKLLQSTAPETLDVTISGLPSAGWGRWIAALLAVVALGWGVLYRLGARRGRDQGKPERREDLSMARDALVDQLARLERARRDEQVGPRTYERLRDALLDALTRILAQLEGVGCQGDEVFPGWQQTPKPAPRAQSKKPSSTSPRDDGSARPQTTRRRTSSS